MTTYHDDNFGEWLDMDDPDNREMYNEYQKTNVEKRCLGCQRLVRIQPHYSYCNACATKREHGFDID